MNALLNALGALVSWQGLLMLVLLAVGALKWRIVRYIAVIGLGVLAIALTVQWVTDLVAALQSWVSSFAAGFQNIGANAAEVGGRIAESAKGAANWLADQLHVPGARLETAPAAAIDPAQGAAQAAPVQILSGWLVVDAWVIFLARLGWEVMQERSSRGIADLFLPPLSKQDPDERYPDLYDLLRAALADHEEEQREAARKQARMMPGASPVCAWLSEQGESDGLVRERLVAILREELQPGGELHEPLKLAIVEALYAYGQEREKRRSQQ